jgi:Chitobiase/beta-hexosaminidase C-terminal domain
LTANPRHRRRALALALSASALAATPADAEVVGDSVADDHNIGVFHNIDFVAAFGAAPGTATTVEVLRDGHRIGTATGAAIDVGEFPAPNNGGLEVNHGPEGAPVPGDCWEGVTPDVIPGDHVTVTRGAEVEEIIVDDITIDDGPTRLDDGDVLLRGRAALADGTPIPISRLDSGEVRNSSDFRGAPTRLFRTPGTTDGWTAIYDDEVTLERERNGPHSPDQRAQLLLSGDHAMGYGHVAPLPRETQLFEGTEAPGPAPGCSAPSESNAVAGADDEAINAASGALTVNGTAISGTLDDDVTGAAVSISDGTRTITRDATGNFGAAGQAAWTASFTRAQLETLADGDITVSARYAAGGGTLGGKTLTLVKDTVAPALTTSVPPGAHTGPLSVALSAGPGETITYRLDGLPQTDADAPYTGPIALGFGTTTIGVRVTDAAGNVTDGTLTYTVNPPPAAPAAPPAAPPATPAPVLAPLTLATPSRTLRAGILRSTRRIRTRTARRRGIRVAFRAPRGTRAARLRLYKVRGSSRHRLVQRTVRTRAGRRAFRLRSRRLRPGLYRITVRVGASRATLGRARTKMVRLVRSTR